MDYLLQNVSAAAVTLTGFGRFVQDVLQWCMMEFGYLTLADGIDRTRQNDWLASRHVHRQEPCNSCWARYLCGGGCHHETIRRGRPACDYIRGWLHFCLETYLRLSECAPPAFLESPAELHV